MKPRALPDATDRARRRAAHSEHAVAIRSAVRPDPREAELDFIEHLWDGFLVVLFLIAVASGIALIVVRP